MSPFIVKNNLFMTKLASLKVVLCQHTYSMACTLDIHVAQNVHTMYIHLYLHTSTCTYTGTFIVKLHCTKSNITCTCLYTKNATVHFGKYDTIPRLHLDILFCNLAYISNSSTSLCTTFYVDVAINFELPQTKLY